MPSSVVRGSALALLWRQALLPFWHHPLRPAAWLAAAILVAMVFGQTWTQTLFASWSKDFYDATVAREGDHLLQLGWQAAGFIALITGLGVTRLCVEAWLVLDWRTAVTRHVLGRWLAGRNYYRLELGQAVDNPDQRIESDIGTYMSHTVVLVLESVASLATVITFSVLVWQKSGSQVVTLGGLSFLVPGYMALVAWAWALLQVGLVHAVGRSLISADFRMQQAGANFRFGMTRVRESAEEIALYRGEAVEVGRLQGLFESLRRLSLRYILLNARQYAVYGSMSQLGSLLPTLVLVPAILADRMSYGDSIEIGALFAQLVGALVWIATSYNQWANWAATGRRVSGLVAAIEAQAGRSGIDLSEADELAVQDLLLRRPGGQPMAAPLSLRLSTGQRCLVTGPSGAGKSTLLRAIAGLWPDGEGRVHLPRGARILFLPQRAYLPPGTVKDALAYPLAAAEVDDARCTAALHACRLPGLVPRLNETAEWGHILSPGEQQRLAFARVLLYMPQLLFLDEATSALDEDNESHLYALLAERLPGCAVLSVGHRPALRRFHHHVLNVQPAPPI